MAKEIPEPPANDELKDEKDVYAVIIEREDGERGLSPLYIDEDDAFEFQNVTGSGEVVEMSVEEDAEEDV